MTEPTGEWSLRPVTVKEVAAAIGFLMALYGSIIGLVMLVDYLWPK